MDELLDVGELCGPDQLDGVGPGPDRHQLTQPLVYLCPVHIPAI